MEKINRLMNTKDIKNVAMKVSAISIMMNLILSLLKLLAGIFGKSGAMISDSVHSASDVLSTVIVIIGINISSKKADNEHQYGHERFESVASIILAVLLIITGIGIGVDGIKKIFGGNYGELRTPEIIALIAAIVSIAVKEWMYWFTRAASRRIGSEALMADAWHHRSDALSSVGAFVGIFCARLGFPILDPVAGIVICIFVIKASVNIFKEATNKLVDKSCDDETVEKIKNITTEQDGVLHIDEIKTRLFGAKVYVDLEISADGSKSLNEAHVIAEQVHDAIEEKLAAIKHCTVRVNPMIDLKDDRDLSG